MKLPAPFAIALQIAFNRYTELDPDSSERIASLQGKVVCLQVRGFDLPIWFIFNEDTVEVAEEFGDTADAVIAGGPFSLMSQALGRRSIFDSDVSISGDTQVAQRFSRCLSEIDIDWEEHLSRLTGDSFAHQTGRLVRGLKLFVSERSDAMRENTADYLRDETNNVPHGWELEEFIERVDELRDRVDLLEANIRATPRVQGE